MRGRRSVSLTKLGWKRPGERYEVQNVEETSPVENDVDMDARDDNEYRGRARKCADEEGTKSTCLLDFADVRIEYSVARQSRGDHASNKGPGYRSSRDVSRHREVSRLIRATTEKQKKKKRERVRKRERRVCARTLSRLPTLWTRALSFCPSSPPSLSSTR